MSSKINVDVSVVLCCVFNDINLDQLDRDYVLSRFKREGFHFLSVTLPKLSKSVLRSLELGFFDRSDLTCFAWKGALLNRFRGLLLQIFDSRGLLLSSPSAAAIGSLRTLCEFFYKLAVPYGGNKIEEAISSFIKNEDDLESFISDQEKQNWAEILRKDFNNYYSEISNSTVEDIFSSHRPRGTNGTFNGGCSDYFIERESNSFRKYPEELKAYYGFFKQYPSLKKCYANLKPVNEPSVSELLLVPKDSRGPRTICREYPHRLRVQMAFFDFLTSRLTYISEGAINFHDQGVNRALAESSSVDKKYATIDLKDASDRVSFSLISRIFRNSPGLSRLIRVRACSVLLPDGSVRKLNKLAGMGSGLTFPSMSLLISLTICREVCNRTNLKYAFVRKNVYIYGDDIIVPTKWHTYALSGLNKVGLKVNCDKSFRLSHFRESCGADFFRGVDVTPKRLRLANSKPRIVYDRKTRRHQITVSGDNAVYQIYKFGISTFETLKNVSRYFLNLVEKYTSPGIISDDPFLVNPHKKTDHLKPDDIVGIYVPTSVSFKLKDNKCPNGLVRDPYRYLSTKISREDKNSVVYLNGFAIDLNKNSIAYSRHDSIEELTVPRKVKLKKVSVPAWLVMPSRSSEKKFSFNSIDGQYDFNIRVFSYLNYLISVL